MRVAVVGATGLVGREMVRVLEESNIEVEEFIPVASQRSAGQKISFSGRDYTVCLPEEGLSRMPHIALFSAGASTSLHWAPIFAGAGTTVIDNSSAWRKDKDIPLVVPEINGKILRKTDRIIANPNCSTIQMVMVLAPLHSRYTIRRVVVSTYQSVSGSGAKGVIQLEHERKGLEGAKFYPHSIDLNLIPHAGDFTPGGYTTEEEKLAYETCKILGDESIRVTATAVRVPVYGAHSEAVNIEFRKPFQEEEIRQVLAGMPGVVVQDNPENFFYPMPKFARGLDDVFVGRIRRDPTIPSGLNLWIVSDSLRKGAATNAVQIAAYMAEHDLVG